MQRSAGRARPIMLLVLTALVLAGCQETPKVQRYGPVIGVKPEELE